MKPGRLRGYICVSIRKLEWSSKIIDSHGAPPIGGSWRKSPISRTCLPPMNFWGRHNVGAPKQSLRADRNFVNYYQHNALESGLHFARWSRFRIRSIELEITRTMHRFPVNINGSSICECHHLNTAFPAPLSSHGQKCFDNFGFSSHCLPAKIPNQLRLDVAGFCDTKAPSSAASSISIA